MCWPSHNLGGKTYTFKDFESVKRKIRSVYPEAGYIGSTSHFTFLFGDEILAEAWLAGTRWHLQIKQS